MTDKNPETSAQSTQRVASSPTQLTPAEIKERRLNALVKAIDWAYVIGWQTERLHQAEHMALASELGRHGGGEYRQEHREPFSRLRAETYFLLGATRQLIRAMEGYGDSKRVPSFVHGKQVLIAVRNAAEHWDGKALSKLAEHTDGSRDDYQFGTGGTVIAGAISVDEVAEWAREVHDHLLKAERDWR